MHMNTWKDAFILPICNADFKQNFLSFPLLLLSSTNKRVVGTVVPTILSFIAHQTTLDAIHYFMSNKFKEFRQQTPEDVLYQTIIQLCPLLSTRRVARPVSPSFGSNTVYFPQLRNPAEHIVNIPQTNTAPGRVACVCGNNKEYSIDGIKHTGNIVKCITYFCHLLSMPG